MKFPFKKQAESKDCGPTCLLIISEFYGNKLSIEHVRQLCETTRSGSSLLGIGEAAESIGFRTLGIKTSFDVLQKEVPLPCIVHWNKNHFAVVYEIKKDRVYVSDPAIGLLTYNQEEFIQKWIGNNANSKTEEGVVLLLEPTPKLYQQNPQEDREPYNFRFISRYLLQYKRLILQLIIGLGAASFLQLLFPFLTQGVVDIGIRNSDLGFVYLILIAQLFIFIGRTSIEVIRSWILLHISTRINISLVSDFFIKLMNLPISFFDVRMTGDIMQRIGDHKRIENLLTSSSLNIIFSLINLLVFAAVLAYYSLQIFGVFVIGSLCYLFWIMFFLKRRKILDYKRFDQLSSEQSKVIELINGMQEIKLHNAEKKKRWAWEHLQARLYKLSIKSLALEQYQSVGSSFINELKNIFIGIISASLVIKGEITLGMMVSITYIVGQLNSPVTQFISFIRQVQDAKISLARLNEIHDQKDEKQLDQNKRANHDIRGNIYLRNIGFRYKGAEDYLFNGLDLEIPENKITALVGVSGSGKTTLMKLLLKFYNLNAGQICIGDDDLESIPQYLWRDKCGVVMQEGYIFNDTIAHNIAINDSVVDKDRLIESLRVANLLDFVQSLPLALNTVIGSEGLGMSTGQKQRLLIARAVYKNPEILLFDEATSSLDANNEKVIMQNLERFFVNKTVVVIAHRLSTVKNADQIVVLHKGRIIEKGTHSDLVNSRGAYYELVHNQLELGS